MSDNQHPGTSSQRLGKARRVLTHSRSTESLRSDFRSQFFRRLRISRSRSVDRFRQLVEDYGERIEYTSIPNLREILKEDPEASDLLQDIEVNELLNQIETELAQVELEDQGEQHEQQTATETLDIVNRHLNTCNLCGELNAEGEICGNCTKCVHNEFKD